MELNLTQQETLHEKIQKLYKTGNSERAVRLVDQYTFDPFRKNDYVDLPEKIFFNEKEGITVLVFPAGERYVAKCSEGDLPNFNPEYGFLVAYAQRVTGLGKTDFNKKHKSLLEQPVNVAKAILIGFFLSRNADFNFERYAQYMSKVLKKSTFVKA